MKNSINCAEIHGVLPNQMYQKSGWIHAESISDCLAHYEITHNKCFGGIKKSGIVFAMRSSGPLPASEQVTAGDDDGDGTRRI